MPKSENKAGTKRNTTKSECGSPGSPDPHWGGLCEEPLTQGESHLHGPGETTEPWKSYDSPCVAQSMDAGKGLQRPHNSKEQTPFKEASSQLIAPGSQQGEEQGKVPFGNWRWR